MLETFHFRLLPLFASAILTTVLPSFALAQLPESTIAISEFFEEIHLLDSSNQSVTDILDSPMGASPFGQHIEVLDPNTIAITSFSDLYFYDVASQTASLFAGLSFTPREITRDGTGDLIAVGSLGVVRIDATTGNETLIHDESFFSPDDAVVDNQGNIFVTEFFDGLGVVNPNGGFTPIGNFGANEFSNLDIATDGSLLLASTSGGDFVRVDQSTGASTVLATNVFSSLEDFQVADNGDILFVGTVASESGVFSLDTVSGVVSSIVTDENINDGFFSPLDIDIFSSTNRVALRAVPEPSSASVLAMIGLAALIRRRRSAN